MGKDLYTLRRKGAMLIHPDGRREPVYFLQLTVRNALSQDSLRLVNLAIREVQKDWSRCAEPVARVVRLGIDGLPRPGAPIFDWGFGRRVYCFDSELPEPAGYLGERELSGFVFVAATERDKHDSVDIPGKDGSAWETGSDYWREGQWRSPEPFRTFREARGSRPFRGDRQPEASRAKRNGAFTKMVSLIHLIESKGEKASPADIQFLGCLKQKVAQLSHSF